MLAGSSIFAQFFSVLYSVVLPILLLIGLGYALKRAIGLDMHTLKTITFYGTLPAVVFVSIVTSSVSLADITFLAGGIVTLMAMQSAITLLYTLVAKVSGVRRRTLVLTTSLGNLGNFGLPLQDLAFRSLGASSLALGYHAYLLVTNNLLAFTAGVFIASGAGPIRRQLRHVLRFPPVYAMVAGVAVSLLRPGAPGTIPSTDAWIRPFWDVLVHLRGAFIALALITLGGQLASIRPGRRDLHIASAVVLRLAIGPLLGYAIVLMFGMTGIAAQVFVLAASAPSAVNTVLLTLEFDAAPDFASRVVFYTTLFAPLTVTIVVLLMRSGLFRVFA